MSVFFIPKKNIYSGVVLPSKTLICFQTPSPPHTVTPQTADPCAKVYSNWSVCKIPPRHSPKQVLLNLSLLHVKCTVWCSEIGSLTSLDVCNSGASSNHREPISLHQAVCAHCTHHNAGTGLFICHVEAGHKFLCSACHSSVALVRPRRSEKNIFFTFKLHTVPISHQCRTDTEGSAQVASGARSWSLKREILFVSRGGGGFLVKLIFVCVAELLQTFAIAPDRRVNSPTASLLFWYLKPFCYFSSVFVLVKVGKGCRYIKQVPPVVKKYSDHLKLTSSFLLILLPWMKLSVTRDTGKLLCVPITSIVLLFCWSATVHIVYLLVNISASLVLRLNEVNAKAVVIQCSQKSLAVALAVLGFLPAAAGDQGLMALPCIAGHLIQLIIDSVVVSVWLAWLKRAKKKKEEAKQEEEKQTSQPNVDELYEVTSNDRNIIFIAIETSV